MSKPGKYRVAGRMSKPGKDRAAGQSLAAKDAFIFFFPTVQNYKSMYFSSVQAGGQYTAPFNTFLHETELLDPSYVTVVTPNNDALYSYAWLDLRAEPLVLSVPKVTNQDGITSRYYCMQFIDAYTYNFEIIGSRTTGNDPRQFLITGPNWNGELPTNMPVFRSKTQHVYILGRTRVYNESDATWVSENIQPHYTLTGYISNKMSPAPTNLPTFLPLDADNQDDDGTLKIFKKPEVFVFVNFLLQYMDMYDGDVSKFQEFAAMQIAPGVNFSPNLGDPNLYGDMQKSITQGMVEIKRETSGNLINGWSIDVSPPLFGTYSDLGGSDIDRAVGAYIGLYGLSPAEAYYPIGSRDSDNNVLNTAGGAKYTLTFPPNEPGNQIDALGFWSVSMYQEPEKTFVANPIERYKIDNTTENLHYNNGSLTIYIQSDEPIVDEEKRNWLPAPTDQKFYLVLRLYVPISIDPPYYPPALQKVSGAK